jgi:polyphenol oxidase
MLLTSPNLYTPHGFFTRKGGVSGGIYASLNCGWGTKDDLANVKENRARVAKKLGTDEARLLSLYQVHGDRVITVDSPWLQEARPQADAMVTKTPGIALGILTADCVPVLLADMKHGVIGAAHAGWKGALAGIIAQTVTAMQALGARPASIAAAIGPCIGLNSYEVGPEFYERFAGTPHYFRPAAQDGHHMFDIRACVRELLKKAGISGINTLENDTYIEEDAFFSFRRTTHRNEPDYGRQVSAIML